MPKKGTIVSKRKNNLYILVVVVISAIILVLLCGTLFSVLRQKSSGGKAGKSAVVQLSKGFKCTADVKLDGNEYEVNVQKPAAGDCTMTFVKPDNLKSLSFVQSEDGLNVKFGALEAAVDPDSIPQASLFNAVSNTFTACVKSEINTSVQNGEVNISGNTKAGAFTITLGSDLKPKLLSIPAIKMNANFKDFQYL